MGLYSDRLLRLQGAEFGRTEVDGEQGSLLHSAEEGAVFREGAVCHPRLTPALAQLVGGEPQLDDSTGPLGCRVFTTLPHPRRHDPAARATLTDHRHMAWHRGIRPRWGTRPGEQPGHMLANWVNTCIFLTDVDTQADGGTMVLSGSHRLDVEHESRCDCDPLIFPCCSSSTSCLDSPFGGESHSAATARRLHPPRAWPRQGIECRALSPQQSPTGRHASREGMSRPAALLAV